MADHDQSDQDDTTSDPADDAEPERHPLRRAADVAKSAVTGAVDYVQDKRYEKTPAGRARAAHEDGATTFHIRLDLETVTHRAEGRGTRDPEVGDAIGAIESEGWRLEDLEYVSERDEWETTDEDGAVTRGTNERTFAVMLFRRVDATD